MMKRLVTYLSIASVVCCITFSACSKKEDVDPEEGKIDEMTGKAADAIVKKIRTPINQARSAKELEDERVKAFDEALKDQ
jgi:hypothetical protein